MSSNSETALSKNDKKLIHNYGLLWKREDVNWGRQGRGNEGKLLGVSGRRKVPVDFRDQIGIYVLYNEAFQIMYVGQAGSKRGDRLFHRLRAHTRDHLAQLWTKFSWFGLRGVRGTDNKLAKGAAAANSKTSKVLDHIEAILRTITNPPYNKQGGRFGDAVQYIQYRDDDALEPTLDEMVKVLWRDQQQASS